MTTLYELRNTLKAMARDGLIILVFGDGSEVRISKSIMSDFIVSNSILAHQQAHATYHEGYITLEY